MLADHLGELEAVEVRHADIDQYDRDVGLQEMLERLVAEAALKRFSPSSASMAS